MLAIFSDTHSTRGHELEGEALAAAQEADAVIHAGDFTSMVTLEAFQELCPVFYPVHGNADSASVRDRLPTVRLVEHDGLRIALTHRRDGGAPGLSLFGRSQDADLVVSGHTHKPTVVETEEIVLLNPGSHAQPRGNRLGFATLERVDANDETDADDTDSVLFRGKIREPEGTLLESFTLRPE